MDFNNRYRYVCFSFPIFKLDKKKVNWQKIFCLLCLSNDKLNLSEFFIEYKSKSKKVIEKVEKLESLSKIVVENKNQKLKKNIQKKIFKKKKYRKKFIVKS